MKYVVFYHPVDGILDKVGPHMAAHMAHIEEFHQRGALLLVGTFGDPQTQGAMSIFRSREEAEAFVAGDPFVTNGLMDHYEIWEWKELLTP